MARSIPGASHAVTDHVPGQTHRKKTTREGLPHKHAMSKELSFPPVHADTGRRRRAISTHLVGTHRQGGVSQSE